MAITSLDQWISAAKKRVIWKKTNPRTAVSNTWFSLFDVVGNPGAGVLAVGNTANGLVHTDAIAGYPLIGAFGASNFGTLGRVDFSNTVASRLRMYDRVFVAGAYVFDANVTLTAQPSYLGRIPDNFNAAACAGQTEIWVETVTAATGNLAVNVTYTNDEGVTGRTTGATGIGAAPTLGRCWQLPLQAGDRGVSQITNVTGSVATAGTFNVMVLRPLGGARIITGNSGDVQDFIRTGMRRIMADSAIYCMSIPDSTSTGAPDIEIDIVSV